jgi:tetratricopeptide (TPR) repeat protein
MSGSSARLWSRAQRHLADGALVPARISLESLLQRDPVHVEAWLVLAQIAHMDGRVREAIRHLTQVVNNLPADARIICEAAETLLRLGETLAARWCLEHSLLKETTDGVVLVRLAALRKMLGEHTSALELLNRASAAGQASADFCFQRALELIFNGQMQQAAAELDKALMLQPTFGRAALALTRLRRQTHDANHLADLRNRLAAVRPGSEDQAALEFAYYKELEDTGSYEEAWGALKRGNDLLFARQQHDPATAWQVIEHLIGRCTSELINAGNVVHEGPQPIFIVGMPRSGTTLLDRVLGNHSRVTSAGELDEFGLQLRWASDHGVTLDHHVLERLESLDFAELGRRYLAQTQWRANGAPFYVDKLPRNWIVAGLIHRALPQARILNLVRDPMDVCFSNYRALLGETFPWSYNLDALAQHYRQYRKVVAHWHSAMPGVILDVDYAALTRHPELTARKVLAFCGLDWEPECIDVTRNKGVVATLSMSQVREPIHTRFFDEWRRYEQRLLPLREAIEV